MVHFKLILAFLSSSSMMLLAQSHNSSVYVTQMGQYNTVWSNIKADQAVLDYSQLGDNNYIQVEAAASQVSQIVSQIGDSNSFQNYAFRDFNTQGIELLQKGSNNDVQIFGSNSISQGMKIQVSGSYKTILVRNYN